MADTSTPSANASFVIDPNSFAVCSLHGLPPVAGRIVEFQKIAQTLREQLGQMDKEKSKAAWLKRGLFAAQLIKASCDGFIATADAIVDSKATNAIAKGYDLASDVAGTMSSAATIGVDKTDLTKIAMKHAAEGLKSKIGGDSEAYKAAGEATVDISKFSASMLADAVNKDGDAVMTDLLGVSASIGRLAVAGAKTTALKRFFNAGEAIANTARSFVKSYREFKEDENDQMYEGLKRSLHQQISMMERKIADIQKAILEIEKERAARMAPIKMAPVKMAATAMARRG